MPSSRFPRAADILFVAPVTAAFFVALSLLVNAETARPSARGRERIGSVTYKNRVAERKMSAQAMWASLEQNAPLFSGDTVHTSAGSSAVLHLEGVADVSLGEETLVRVDSTSAKTEIGLDSGFLAVRRSPASRAIGISSGGDSVELREGGLSARRSGEELALSVEDGAASLTTAAGTRGIAAGDSLVVGGGGGEDLPAKLLEPPAGGTLYLSAGEAIGFRWAMPSPAGIGAAKPMRLVVAADSSFSRIEAEIEAKADRTALSLGAGTHYWKLVASDRAGGDRSASAVGWFNALAQEAPDPVEPRDRSFYCVESPPILPFSWRAVPNALAYRLELRDRKTGRVLLTKQVADASLSLDSLGQGEYRWRVGALLGPDGREFLGGSADFAVVSRPAEAPSLRSRGPAGNGSAVAEWDEIPGADYYEAKVSSDPGGRAVVAQARASTNSMREALALAPGDYYLMVRSVSGGSKSEYSRAMAFTVAAARPLVALAPAEGFEADPIGRRIRFRWDDPDGSGPVKLQLSDEVGFSRPWSESEASAGHLELGIPEDKSGRIYWRVSASSGGKDASSAPRSFIMPALLAAPRIVSPAEGAVLDVDSLRSLRLAWKASPGAERYAVRVFMLLGGRKSLVQSWDTQADHVTIDRFEPYDVGELSWTIVARKDSDGAAPARSPEETAFFALSKSRALPAPVVHLPAAGED